MGADFLSRTKKTHRKTIDDHRVALATGDLFSISPAEAPAVYLGTIRADTPVTAGESLIAEVRGSDSIELRRGIETVGAMDNPSLQVIDAIKQAGGIACAVIHRVHTISKKVDVSLC